MTRLRECATASAVWLTMGAAAASAQEPPSPRGLTWDDRPSIVFGEDIHVDLRFRINSDWRTFSPNLDEDVFAVDAGRIGLKGELTRHLDFEIERDFEDDEWKDVYLNWDTFEAFSVRGGRFKMPVGLEQNISRTDLDFVFRSRASAHLTPARSKGVMVQGRRLNRALSYDVGLFHADGDIGRLEEPQFATGDEERGLGPTFAGRVTVALLRPFVSETSPLRSLRAGLAYSNGRLPEGLNSLRGETPYGFDYFEPVYVKGRRQRTGLELDWTPGPAGVRAEWLQSREDRQEQGLGDADLSDVIGTGWYLSGTWIVTGESKDDNVNPRRSIIRGGTGAIEIAARYDQLGFGSASSEGEPERNPRAEHILGNTDHIWTLGVNWYPVRHVKIIGNAIHESFEDEERTPVAGKNSFWSGVLRFQLVF
jgi:phosphate-selective porin OprO/OprP